MLIWPKSFETVSPEGRMRSCVASQALLACDAVISRQPRREAGLLVARPHTTTLLFLPSLGNQAATFSKNVNTWILSLFKMHSTQCTGCEVGFTARRWEKV